MYSQLCQGLSLEANNNYYSEPATKDQGDPTPPS